MSEPITRKEMYLAKAGGESIELPTPITREEFFLAKAAGMDVEIPEPITRVEQYLSMISGGGGGSATLIDKSISANGTYIAENDSADGYKKVVVNVPSGITNIKTGSFTAVEGAADNIVDTGYTGNGYPVAMLVVVDGGLENNTNASSQMWQASPVNIIGAYYMAKSNFNLAPIYDSTNNIPVEDRANIVTTRKSGSGTTSFNYKGAREIKFFTGSGVPTGGTGSSETAIKFYDKKTFKYAAGSANGFCVGAVYNWWIIYSS